MGGISSGHVSPLAINTLSGMRIKSEPITPPRDSTTPSGQGQQLRPQSGGTGHLSPSLGPPGHLSPNNVMPGGPITGHLSPSPNHMAPGGPGGGGGGPLPGHLSPLHMGHPASHPGGHISPVPPAPPGHTSPGQHIVHSNNNSPTSQQLEHDSPMIKRSRMEGWTT